jgi:hypothetical protein
LALCTIITGATIPIAMFGVGLTHFITYVSSMIGAKFSNSTTGTVFQLAVDGFAGMVLISAIVSGLVEDEELRKSENQLLMS